MSLNKELIGKEYPPTTTEATLDATIRGQQPAGRRAGAVVPADGDGQATDHHFE